jgi:nucleotide-binding universal stress UspA family protein
MTIRSILVHVQPTPAEEPRLEAAVDLARSFDATLIGLGAEAIIPMTVGDPIGFTDSAYLVELRQQAMSNLEAAARRFERASAGLKTRWVQCEQLPIDAICNLARGADLVVAGGAPLREDVYHAVPIDELIVSCGRPVLVAPPAAAPLRGQAAVVAWKDTREARRALYDSLPLLRKAKDVVVLEVAYAGEFAESRARVDDVVEALARHGVTARAQTRSAGETNILGEIEACAEVLGADLIVAGGYGNSRLREMILGGVTRGLLRQSSRYVLFSH